jgi:hypothetical protein
MQISLRCGPKLLTRRGTDGRAEWRRLASVIRLKQMLVVGMRKQQCKVSLAIKTSNCSNSCFITVATIANRFVDCEKFTIKTHPEREGNLKIQLHASTS